MFLFNILNDALISRQSFIKFALNINSDDPKNTIYMATIGRNYH